MLYKIDDKQLHPDVLQSFVLIKRYMGEISAQKSHKEVIRKKGQASN